MKPVKIVISAFGSYAENTEISFEEVNSGIFLITGDTGAGKTTIFDAITYALYEQTSGGIRDGNMMRSQFADDDTPTYVELTFIYQGKIYKINRNPQYERRSKRKTADGTGLTTEAPKVELSLPDGKAFIGSKTETNNKIVEIIGIDKDQFTQIAMIAQGDFLKLLHANSDERKKIFSKIFDTKIYNKISEALSNKIREINTELAKNKTLCEHELKNIVYSDDSIYKEQLSALFFNFEFKTDEILEYINKINDEIKEKEQGVNNQKENAQEKLNNINALISNAETVNKMFSKLKQSTNAKMELEAKLDEQKIKEKKLNSAKKAEKVKADETIYLSKLKSFGEIRERVIGLNNWLKENETKLEGLSKELEASEKNKLENEEKLTSNIARINDTLAKYDELETKKASVFKLSNEKTILEKNISSLKADIENKKSLKEKLEKEQESLSNCYEIYTEQQLKTNKLENRVAELEELNKLANEFNGLKGKYEMSIIEANTAFTAYSKYNSIYEEMYRAFLAEQAGVLAKEKLVDNVPCPVCGSLEHPNIAELSENAPTQALVEKAKKERDNAEKQNSLANEKLQVAKHAYDLKLETVLNKTSLMINKNDSSKIEGFENLRLVSEALENTNGNLEESKLLTIIELINKALESVKKEFEQSKKALEIAANNKSKYEANSKNLNELSKALNEKATSFDEVTIKYNELNLNFTTLSTSIDELKKQLLFDTKDDAINKINAYRANLKAINDAVVNATNKFNSLSKELEAKKGQKTSELENGTRIKAESEECKTTYFSALESNGFSNEDEYKSSKLDSVQIEALQADIDSYNKKFSDINNEIKIYTEQTEGKSELALDSMLKEKRDLSTEFVELDKQLKLMYALNKKNSDAKISIEKLFKERKEIRAQFEIYDSLNKTANGKISEKIKMDFETYVQRQYFNMIIAAANKRLSRMTSGQFLLQCRELSDLGNRGPVGLDLDIYSLVTDTTRDIKTLSGGESFMAALSMALGLSDVIQLSSGAVHLDTMFVDEGFGSLDDNSRAQAIAVLNDLAGNNRLVGIISHVSELKEQIDNKLIVKKSEKGSKVFWAE
jgi:exonuclease SbcC